MFKKFMLVGVLLLTLVGLCIASDGVTTTPVNTSTVSAVSKVASVSEAINASELTNVTKATNTSELTNVSKATNTSELTNITKATKSFELTNVTKATNTSELNDVAQSIKALKSTDPVETIINDSAINSNNSSKLMEIVPGQAIGTESAETGIATDYWIELIPYPATNPTSLWLLVNGDWRKLDNPNDAEQSLVKGAFCDCPTSHHVKVWYQADRIVGLVATSSSL